MGYINVKYDYGIIYCIPGNRTFNQITKYQSSNYSLVPSCDTRIYQKNDLVNRNARKEDKSTNLLPYYLLLKLSLNQYKDFKMSLIEGKLIEFPCKRHWQTESVSPLIQVDQPVMTGLDVAYKDDSAKLKWYQPSDVSLLHRFQQIQGTTECLTFTLLNVTSYCEGKIQLTMNILNQDTSIIQHVCLQFQLQKMEIMENTDGSPE